MTIEKRLRRIHHRHTKLQETLRDKGLREILATPEGRSFIWWLLEQAGVFSNPFQENALKTAFLCGNMNFGQSVLNLMLEVDPEAYIKMMRENADRQTDLQQELEKAKNEIDELE